MNGHSWFAICFLFVLLVSFDTSYACTYTPPNVFIDGPDSAYVGQTVEFDGSDSFDSDGFILEYEWILPSSAYYISGQGTSTLRCKFNTPATDIEVKLRVVDNDGCNVYETHTIDILAVSSPWCVSPDGDDDNNGQSWQEAFKTIQMAIDSASDGHTIIAAEGTYYETINFEGKDITVTGTDPDNWGVVDNTVIDGYRSGSVVTFGGSESSSCKLQGFTITGGGDGQALAAHWKFDETGGTSSLSGLNMWV